MERNAVEQWVRDYERLWRTPGTAGLSDLFAPDATYLPSPWAHPVTGLDAITAFWEDGRDGADEEFTFSAELVAVEGDTAVARVAVDYADPGSRRWRDLWVIRLAPDGRCRAFEEWPFAPDQDDGH
jgi:ketosteroid isomerase-like protein